MPESRPAPFPFHLLSPPDPAALPLPRPVRPAEGVRLLRDAVYRVPEGGRPLTVDLWLPETAAAQPVPVVVFVHGGGWRAGRKDDPGPRFRDWEPGPFARLAQQGFGVACPQYRLSGEARYPAQSDDLAAALAWLHARAGELGLDTARTVLWGESAGGHLAALAALSSPAPGASATITGCVTWYAPTDLPNLGEDLPGEGRHHADDPCSREALLLGGPPGREREAARAASPVSHAGPGAPPFLLLHGTDDALVPARQSVRLAEALREHGHQPELRLIAGGNHLWVGLDDEEVRDCYLRTLDFARRCTRARGD
ncbi:alpha/beta hydrolase [Kitasatospora phosalacinea]|uniref:alpha/beta hydrolase n=1 Tax=Kitasatospora phosalacinea TaxID=2065 RepID=UPI0005256319|nr:alpha/beta hydrolase [Kitasatospora phosalacinea]